MRWTRAPWAWLAIIWAGVYLARVHFQVAMPGPDVVQFKGPGVYFAQHGLLGGVNLPFSPPNVPLVYAFYPPLYPLLFGLWCSIAGVSLQSSNAFDLLIRTLRSIMIIATVWPTLRQTAPRGRWLAGVSVLLLSFCPNNEDRPDDLSIALALGSWLALRTDRLAASGMLLGLCGATSPAGGIFGALGAVFLCRTRPRPARSLLIVALLSIVVVGAAIAPLVAADPTVLERFLRGVHFNAMPYGYTVADRPLNARIGQFVHERYQYFLHGLGVLVLLASLALLTLWSWRKASAAERRWASPFLLTSLVFGPLVFLAFPKDPLYLWFANVGLVIVVLGLAQGHRRFALVQIVIVLGAGAMLARESKQWLDGLTRPSSQTVQAVQARLTAQIPASARVSVWPDAYFTLAGVHAVESIEFTCPVIDTYDYAFVASGTTFPEAPGAAPSLSAWCRAPATQCFTIQDDFRSAPLVPWIGPRTGMRTRGFGGILYKRTGC